MSSQKNDHQHLSHSAQELSDDQSCKHNPAKKCCKYTSTEEQGHCQDVAHHHDHHNCSHEHHHHDHHNCSHDHHHTDQYTRHQYSESEVANFSSLNVDQLIGKVNNLLEHEFYGKAVPLLEIIAKKLQQEKDISEEHKKHTFETQHHLALTYGIIGEHKNSLLLWQDVIKIIEQKNDLDELLEAYYNAALSAEQAQNETDFLNYLNTGLNKAIQNKLEEWEATFEHELAVYHFEKQNLAISEQKLNRSIAIFTAKNNEESLVASYYYLAYLKEKLEQISDAKALYEKALQLSKKEEVRLAVEYERALIEERLANINKKHLKAKLLDF